jgi:hypothetical protein
MQGDLATGGFVRLAWRLAREAATGLLTLDEGPSRHELYLRRGYLTAARVAGVDARLGQILVTDGVVDAAALDAALHAAGPRLFGHALRQSGDLTEAQLDSALRRQAEARLARLAAIVRGTYRFDGAAQPPPGHRSGRPLALSAWVRRHVDSLFSVARARAFADGLGEARLTLRKDLAPDPADGDDVDRRILAALAAPRRLDELARAAGVPRPRLLQLVWFLGRVGALEPGVHPVLGVAPGAAPAEVKRAFHRLARELHPDLNPEADPGRLAEVIEAYRTFLG